MEAESFPSQTKLDLEKLPLNLATCDEMVIEELYYMGFTLQAQVSTQCKRQFAEYQEKLSLLNAVGEALKIGNIEEAVKYMQTIQVPQIFNDPKFVFRLHKQQFIEYLRMGLVDRAIEYAKKQFGPFALNAFPEAYSEFKKSLLLLVYTRFGESSPVQHEWSITELELLSAVILSTLYATLRPPETKISLLIRYLVTIHNIYHIMQGMPSPIPEIESLLLPERAPTPLRKEAPSSFKEQDIQTLAQAVGVSRQDAIESLKYTNGDINEALKMELGRVKINRALFERLLIEYGHFRGLLSRDAIIARIQESQSISSDKEKMVISTDEKIEQLKKVRQLTNDGNIQEAINCTTSLNPTFLQSSPHLYFQLKQCEVVDLVHRDQHEKAMSLVRENLAPVTLSHPELVPDLKQTAVLLAYNSERLSNSKLPVLEKVKGSTLSGPLFTALGQSIGLQEPKLVQYMKYLLYVHTQWFKQQLCEDSFNGLFSLPQLKTSDTNTNSDAMDVQPTQPTVEEKLPFDENKILTLMEFMAVSRTEAIALLHQFDGNINEIFAIYLP